MVEKIPKYCLFNVLLMLMRVTEWQNLLDTASAAARLAGDLILLNLGSLSKEDITTKQAADFVTRVDREAEQLIVETIKERYPDHRFIAEESFRDTSPASYRWIIDPLDGTTNYIHGYPIFSISIALQFREIPMLGLIFDPVREEIFTAIRGKGAFLNSRPIRVSPIENVMRSLVTTGFPFRKRELIDDYVLLFKNIFVKVSDIRRAGSAALDLAYVACGRCEAFFEIGLSLWDIAAGSLIVQEAGGVITDFGGKDKYLTSGNIVAGNPNIHPHILTEVQNVFKTTLPQ
jgi:myo-inositol-1(or 4)-monophosphatase